VPALRQSFPGCACTASLLLVLHAFHVGKWGQWALVLYFCCLALPIVAGWRCPQCLSPSSELSCGPVLSIQSCGVIEPVGIRHSVQVIEVAEVFVKTAYACRSLFKSPRWFLPNLAGLIAQRLQHCCQRNSLVRDANVNPGLAHRSHSRAQGTSAGLASVETRCANLSTGGPRRC